MMKPKQSNISILIALIVCLMLTAFSLPAKNGKSNDKNERYHKENEGTQVAIDIFLGKDRRLIRSYFANHRGNLPPGLAKRRGNLPPGLRKQLRRKGQLPPGLQKGMTPFPVELERSLSPLKDGLERGFIEGRAVIYNRQSSVILDIFTVL